jgi:hypothetical protein
VIPNEQPHEHLPRSIFSTWIGVVLLFAFFGLLVLVVIGASPRGDAYEEKRAKVRAEKLQGVREQTTAALTTYSWVDKTKGVVRIPINDAMKLTVAELSQKSPAPANPIPAAEASPAPPSAPAAASPAPSPASVSETPKPTSVSGPNSENRSQPAAANNPPPAPPGTQPGASAAPAASTPSAAIKPAVSPSAAPAPSAHGTPLPVRGKTP